MNTEQSEICPLRLVMDVVGGKMAFEYYLPIKRWKAATL